jgi:competence protein ComEA
VPTTNERKALWFLAVVALSGSGVRLWRSAAPPPPIDGSALAHQLRRVDSVRAAPARSARRTAKQSAKAPDVLPATPPQPVDLDVAPAEEIERLPGIGPQLAARIVRDREKHGPFGGWEALDAVKGIGPSLRRALDTLVRFSAPPRVGGRAEPARRPRDPGEPDAVL